MFSRRRAARELPEKPRRQHTFGLAAPAPRSIEAAAKQRKTPSRNPPAQAEPESSSLPHPPPPPPPPPPLQLQSPSALDHISSHPNRRVGSQGDGERRGGEGGAFAGGAGGGGGRGAGGGRALLGVLVRGVQADGRGLRAPRRRFPPRGLPPGSCFCCPLFASRFPDRGRFGSVRCGPVVGFVEVSCGLDL